MSVSERPLRVLHVIEDLGSGGAERLLYVNLAALNRSRFQNVVCHLYDRALHWRQPILDLGVPVEPLHLSSIRDLPRGVGRLRALLARRSFDVIHTHLYGANLVGRVAGRLSGVPVVSSLHNPDYEPAIYVDNPALSPAKAWALRQADRATTAFARPSFIAVSEYVKQSAIEHLGLDGSNITVVYNPVDLDYFKRDDERKESALNVRRELHIAENAPVLVTVARLDPQKGLRYLIEALPALIQQFPSLVAVFVGGGSPASRAALEALASERGVSSHVRFTGPQPNVPLFLAMADVFVLPSLYEGMGIALVEAMAMERACVATRATAIPEVVQDGVTGVLVPPADPAALAAAIAPLLADPILCARMGAAGRRAAHQHFDVRHNVLQLEAVYASAARVRKAA